MLLGIMIIMLSEVSIWVVGLSLNHMTPSLFEPFQNGNDQSGVPVDEYHWTQTLGKEAALRILQNIGVLGSLNKTLNKLVIWD